MQGFFQFIFWCLRVWERTWNRLRLIWSDLNIQYTSWIRPYTCLFMLSLVISWLLSLHKQYDLRTCYMSVRHVMMFCEGYLKVKQSICGDDQVHVWNKPPKYIVQKNQFTCLPQICITGTKYLYINFFFKKFWPMNEDDQNYIVHLYICVWKKPSR